MTARPRPPWHTVYATVAYNVRHLRTDLLQRLKIRAIAESTSIEEMLNRVLAVGLNGKTK